MSSEMQHIPVLYNEVIDGLNLQPNSTIIDATVGGGGHSAGMLERIAPHGIVIGFDRDRSTLNAATQLLHEQFGQERFIPIHDTYAAIDSYAQMLVEHEPIMGIVADLGYSSMQIDDTERGFSFQGNGPLDMRFDQSSGMTAAEFLRLQPEEELQRIFKEYGEIPASRKLAALIVQRRETMPFETVEDLRLFVEDVLPRKRHSRIHPATQLFQALRIAVNDELRQVSDFLPKAMRFLAPGGRLAIISFHSLEDRIVKHQFRDFITDCICPPEFPECRCDHPAIGRLITKKPIIPSEKEVEENPRARSAKLRIIEKIQTS